MSRELPGRTDVELILHDIFMREFDREPFAGERPEGVDRTGSSAAAFAEKKLGR
jgi:hypothetical protein